MHSKEHLINEVKEAWQIALFKQPAMHKVAAETHKNIFGYYIIIAGAVLAIIGQMIFPAFFKPTLLYSVIMGVMQVVMAVLGIYVISYIAKKLFKGHATHDQFFRVAAYATIVMWVGLIPQLSIIGGLWELALLFVILKAVHKLSTEGAIGTILVTIVVFFILSAIVSPLYMRFGSYGIMGSMKFSGAGKTIDLSEGKVDMGDAGKVEYGGNKMKITNEKGETMEIEIPNIQ